MRYLILVKATESSTPAGPEALAAMARFKEQAIKAGVLLAAEGLQPGETGACIEKSGGQTLVTDGPCNDTRESVEGFWIIKAGNRAQALTWAMRVPLAEGDRLEVRRITELSDFAGNRVSAAALAREQAWRDGLQNP